jgi:hypothetical protein
MEQVNYQVFELNGVALPLDMDDMNVTRRVDVALKSFQDRGPEIDALGSVAEKAYALVDSMRTFITEAFADDTAADKYFGDECRLSALNRLFNELAQHIGKMRAAAYNAASVVFTASNAARVLTPEEFIAAAEVMATADARKAAQDAPEVRELKYMGKPYDPTKDTPTAPNVRPLKPKTPPKRKPAGK